ncbi:lytic polysaccharide monooxygenase [Streptomyces sp. NPDC002138]|uniref:lytic polysaccharide monooxygenase n=1 Tax=Streptomyces sp. NPDC002138 TaxID=3154410 RepID=UPI0033268FB9
MAGLKYMSPESRQVKYLMANQAAVRGGKFIRATEGGVSDPDVRSDIVNRLPPRDGQIASAGNPYAFKLDGVRDEFGNEWSTHPVRSGDSVTVSLAFDEQVKVRRVVAYLTKANWDRKQPLSRASFDLLNPVYLRSYPAAPYQEANKPIPNGLVAPTPFEFSFNLPARPVGHHVALFEFDDPGSADAFYFVIDWGYIG